MFGRILEIVTPDGGSLNNGFVTLERFHLGDHTHPEFDMPVLTRFRNVGDSTTFITIPSAVCISSIGQYSTSPMPGTECAVPHLSST